MKLILEKKVNSILLGVLLYLSFCFSGFYMARGDLAYSLISMSSVYASAAFANSIFAFLFGGIMSFILFEIITLFLMRLMRMKLGAAVEDMRYALRFFYIAANVITGLISLLFYISPIISVYGLILVPFIVNTVFIALYILFVCKHYVQKDRIAAVLMHVGGTYLIICAVSLVVQILGTVVL